MGLPSILDRAIFDRGKNRAADVTTKLKLSIAAGTHDRVRPLFDGEVQIDSVAPIIMLLSPEEMFLRAFGDPVFDVSELSLSSLAL
jgi:4,5-dihydroxyphthalate decarboxylase